MSAVGQRSAAGVEINLPFVIRRPSLVLTIITVLLVIGIGLFQWQRYTTFQAAQRQLLQKSAEAAADEIETVLLDQQKLLTPLVSGQGDLLSNLVKNADDQSFYNQLDNTLLNNFIPDYRGFTITSSKGQLLVPKFGNLALSRELFLARYQRIHDTVLDEASAEETWRDYLSRFQQSGRYGHFSLHPNSEYASDDYFGFTATWFDTVVFVALSPDIIARILRNYQLTGHRLVLLRRAEDDAERWIEITTEEASNRLVEKTYLDIQELQRVVAMVPVKGTLWDLVAFPEQQLFLNEIRRLIWEYILIVLGLSIFVVLTLWYINRETIQRQIAMRSLRQSEERFSQLAEHLHQVFWMYGAEGMLYLSPAYESVWGRSRQGLYDTTETWLDAVHPDDRTRVQVFHGDEAAAGEFEEEYRVIRPDGTVRWIWDRGFPIRNESGALYRTAGIAEDITERKRAEEVLKQTEASYKTVVEDQTELICRFLSDYTLSFVNAAFSRYFERSPQDLIGMSFLDFATQDDRVAVEAALQSLNDHRPTTTYEHRIATDNGAGAWLQWNYRALFDSENTLIGYQSVGRDITERKRMEEELHRAHGELEARVQERTQALEVEIAERRIAEEKIRSYAAQVERSNRELKDFAYVCSHDLQEPLRKIQAFGDRLKSRFADELPERGKDYLERMQSAAARMQQLINDLLVLSRVENRALNCSRVNLNEIIKQVAADLEIKLEETRGHLEITELPTVEADPVQMRQVFQNLIGNALKFHRTDVTPVVKIYCHPVAHTQSVQIYVEDNGIGFDEKFLDKIFTAFQRLHTRENYEGTGIGLSICARIAARHNGNITARSSPGQGATFIVTLPLQQPDQCN